MLSLMTEEEVSKRLSVSVASLRRWRLLSRGPQFIKVGALVRYRPEDLDEWLTTLPRGGGKSDRNRQMAAVGSEHCEINAPNSLATTN
jgi:predicted DNA-binding transcriptional regulator AlpA